MSESPLQRAVAIAVEVRDGKLDILNGCYQLAREIHAAGLDRDPDFRTFIGVESESDHLPYRPDDRRHWDVEVLSRKDKEISEVAAWYRESVLAACRRLIERFGQPPISESLISD